MVEQPSHGHGEFRSKSEDIDPRAKEIPALPLGPFGDVPAAYAVIHAELDHEAKRATRTFFAYASQEYCRLADCSPEELMGASHLEVVKSEFKEWTENCYRAIVNGETVNGVDFSPLTQSWVSYNIAPSPIENCCVFAFVPIDEQQWQSRMSLDAKTSRVVSDLLATLAGETDYDTAMNGMLELIAGVLPADRLSVYVCNDVGSLNAFERCVEGVQSQVGTKTAMSKAVLKMWFNSVSKEPIVLVPDTAVIARFSQPLYEWCVETDVHNLLAAPFYSEGEIVGFLGAYNYTLDGTVDIARVFSVLSSFVGARMDNHRLIEDLAWASSHDPLTNLLNRRGARLLINDFIAANPDLSLALGLADLDDFKSINDRFGHAAGDSALEAMGASLMGAFPEGAILSRMGGDEFLIALTGDDALQADRLFEGFAATQLEYEDEEAGVTRPLMASVGYACFPVQEGGFRDMFARADKALYAMKNSGKSGCMKYSPDMD